ncbi:hypothetical protein OS493_008243 [Desmophyllum pertusum]|uniref:Uncharacterized protein n=1 Tax=Desmophyllum pertusum TaxID=174260 RepID=A0A9X0DAX4_9CNID|nr:hypothetical protein OS493_008243 [Desmophyllum pertusum]
MEIQAETDICIDELANQAVYTALARAEASGTSASDTELDSSECCSAGSSGEDTDFAAHATDIVSIVYGNVQERLSRGHVSPQEFPQADQIQAEIYIDDLASQAVYTALARAESILSANSGHQHLAETSGTSATDTELDSSECCSAGSSGEDTDFAAHAKDILNIVFGNVQERLSSSHVSPQAEQTSELNMPKNETSEIPVAQEIIAPETSQVTCSEQVAPYAGFITRADDGLQADNADVFVVDMSLVPTKKQFKKGNVGKPDKKMFKQAH